MQLTMRLFQQRGIWYVEFERGKRRSLQTKDKADAKRMFAQIKREWLAGKLSHLTGQCTKTLGEFADEYLEWAVSVQPRSTYRANRLSLGKLHNYAGRTCPLDRISQRLTNQLLCH